MYHSSAQYTMCLIDRPTHPTQRFQPLHFRDDLSDFRLHLELSKPQEPSVRASLVDPVAHCLEFMQLIEIKLARPVIEYVVDCVFETVDYALARSGIDTDERLNCGANREILLLFIFAT
ncbi:hypothetical protein DFH08DRAFT_950739 [Mycena albidolilacea]|uniref:Uncharacterized protein n=1 Tax=Mycena albidolilacea TaxID=1033008 RepID=A0AAD7F108_9AGAR|nr:hypothetical protein DFH08DRAFT_950739 [Mycena albidolilacea]